jgi:predicted ATPase
LTTRGEAFEGLTLLTQALAAERATGNVHGSPRTFMMLATAYANLGRTVEAMNCLAEAAQIIEKTNARSYEVELHRIQGKLLNAAGERSAAEQSYRRALAVAGRQSAKLFELLTATDLARFWSDQGKRNEAHDLLAPVYGWFTEGFDTPVLRHAKALLDELR